MYEEVKVLTHSSIRIAGDRVLYFDPYEVTDEYHDADMVFITHDHYDHYSPEDIKKVAKADTCIVMPQSMRGQEDKSGIHNVKFIAPGESSETDGIAVSAVAAYNRMKPFHMKSRNFVGYVVTMSGIAYYVAGDTDMTDENSRVKCDVALVPVGGKFTMDYKEAAKLVNGIGPKLAIPTHYGKVTGSPEDGEKFARLVNDGIEVRIMI